MGTDEEGVVHPLYLTSDSEGGYGTKSDYEAKVTFFYEITRDRKTTFILNSVSLLLLRK